MPLKYFLPLLLSLFLSASYSHAQYRNSIQDFNMKNMIEGVGPYQRLSMGVGKHYLIGKANLNHTGWDTGRQKTVDTIYEENLKMRNTWTAYLGTFFPISVLSDNSMLVLNTEFMLSLTSLTYDTIKLMRREKYVDSRDVHKAGALLSLEYRIGGDVPLRKDQGTMLTLGAGINPCIVSSQDYSKIKPYEFIPFIKGEVGFFAGMAFKVRGIIYFGSSVYADDEAIGISKSGVGDKLKTYMSGNNGFDIAVVIMPFSVGWRGGGWR